MGMSSVMYILLSLKRTAHAHIVLEGHLEWKVYVRTPPQSASTQPLSLPVVFSI